MGIQDRAAGTGQIDRTFRTCSMDRIAGTGTLGDKSAETGSLDRTGQLERTVGRGQRWQNSHGRKDTTGLLEKTGHEIWDRTTKTGQPRQDNQDRTTVAGQPGKDS